MAKHLIKKDELSKQYKRIIDKMQRETVQLVNKGTFLEAKLRVTQTLNKGQNSQRTSMLPDGKDVDFDNVVRETQIQEALINS